MQWLLAFLGAYLASVLNENEFVGGIGGFLLGNFLSVSPRLKKQALQLAELRQHIEQLKQAQKRLSQSPHLYLKC